MSNENRPDDFKPDCLSGLELSLSNLGYIIPCCNIDNRRIYAIEPFGMLDDKFKMDNIEDIGADVLLSDEWSNFFKTLKEDYENVPYECKERCRTSKWVPREVNREDDRGQVRIPINNL